MNAKYKVSVIIPCFNAGKFLNKTLDSVMSQTYQSLEILAIDDGSTDNTREILDHFPSIRVLKHLDNLNLGQAASLNKGIENAEGDFIAFLDADDIWHPTKIEQQIQNS